MNKCFNTYTPGEKNDLVLPQNAGRHQSEYKQKMDVYTTKET